MSFDPTAPTGTREQPIEFLRDEGEAFVKLADVLEAVAGIFPTSENWVVISTRFAEQMTAAAEKAFGGKAA